MSAAGDGRFEQEYFETTYRHYARQNPPRKLRFYRRLVERAAPPGRVPRVLDIGCAFGAFLATLDPGWPRFGTDVSRHALERARTALPGATLACAGVEELPFPGPFEIVTAFDVIEHVPSLPAVAAAVRARLAADGRFIFVVPVYDGLTGPLIRRLDRDPTHVHKRSRDFWLDWTREHFELLDWCGICRYLLAGLVYVHWPTRVGRRHVPAIAVTAGPGRR